VAAELARPICDHLRLVAKLRIRAPREFVSALLKQRARLADMAQLDFDLRERGQGDREQPHAAESAENDVSQRAAAHRSAAGFVHDFLLHMTPHMLMRL